MNPEDGKQILLLWVPLGDWQVGQIRGPVQVQVQAEAKQKWRYGLPKRLLPHLHAHPAETMYEELEGQSNL